MRCLIVDDDSALRQELRRFLEQRGHLFIVEAGDVSQALQQTSLHQPHVVFLDVQLWGETGFDYLDRLEENSPHVVFVTAHDDFAVQGFEREAVDYLLKPVSEERLHKTMERLQRRISKTKNVPEESQHTVTIREGSKLHIVPWETIHAIMSDGNYTRVCYADGTETQVLRPLKEWLTLAPATLFVQVHRTALIRTFFARTLVNSPTGHRYLVLQNGRTIPVGRTYWQTLKQILT